MEIVLHDINNKRFVSSNFVLGLLFYFMYSYTWTL